MKLSEQLSDAMGRPSERVALGIGQHVEIRSKRGELVATGDIQEIAVETGMVRVANQESGADVQMAVDPTVYDIWVVDREVPGSAPFPGEQPRLSIRASRAGVYMGGRH